MLIIIFHSIINTGYISKTGYVMLQVSQISFGVCSLAVVSLFPERSCAGDLALVAGLRHGGTSNNGAFVKEA